jgi:hypothetical protein
MGLSGPDIGLSADHKSASAVSKVAGAVSNSKNPMDDEVAAGGISSAEADVAVAAAFIADGGASVPVGGHDVPSEPLSNGVTHAEVHAVAADIDAVGVPLRPGTPTVASWRPVVAVIRPFVGWADGSFAYCRESTSEPLHAGYTRALGVL